MRDELREKIAKTLFDWIDDDGWEWEEVDEAIKNHYRGKAADSILSLLAPELEKARLWDEKCCPYGSHNLSTCWAKFGHDHYSKLPNETKCPQYTPDKVDGICTFIECSKRNADCIVNGLIKEPT
jgi:hypothetical protein